MAKFIRTKAIAGEIESIIATAKTRLYLLTYNVIPDDALLERLKEAIERGVKCRLVFFKITETHGRKICDLNGLSLYRHSNLHAKCFINEHSAIVGSMNLSAYSEEHNREMGFLITSSEDVELFPQVEAEVQSILTSAEEVEIDGQGRWHPKEERTGHEEGFCIRCRESISFEPGKPFCFKCFNQWSREGEYVDNRERHCHSCGLRHKATLEKPLCYDCYKEFEFARDMESQIDNIERYLCDEDVDEDVDEDFDEALNVTANIAQIMSSRFPEATFEDFDWGVVCNNFTGRSLRLEIRPRSGYLRIELHPTEIPYEDTHAASKKLLKMIEPRVAELNPNQIWSNHRVVAYFDMDSSTDSFKLSERVADRIAAALGKG
jgi:hypothetical protein